MSVWPAWISSDVSLAVSPSVVASRLPAKTPVTVKEATRVSALMVAALAAATPVIIKAVVVFLRATLAVYCAAVRVVAAKVR